MPKNIPESPGSNQVSDDRGKMISIGQRRNAYFILILPFFINDFGFIALKGTYQLYLLDYTVRALVIITCFSWSVSRTIAFEKIRAGNLPIMIIPAAIIIPVAVHLVLELIAWNYKNPEVWGALFRYPAIANPILKWFDLTVGLLLVAVSEELIGRKFAFSWLSRVTKNSLVIIIVSASIFAVLHWGHGLINVIKNFVMGLVFMALYLKVKKLWPLIIAHWIINFMVYY